MRDQNQDSNRPIAKHRDGHLETAIWKRKTEKGPVYNTERSRSYQDKDGNWRKTNVIPERDLLRAARLDEKAYETIQGFRERDRAAYVKQQSGRQRRRDHGRER